MSDPLKHVEEAVEFAENPGAVLPVRALAGHLEIDAGEAINSLNQGLVTFHSDLRKDSLATRRVEVAMVTFGHDVEVVHNSMSVDSVYLPPY